MQSIHSSISFKTAPLLVDKSTDTFKLHIVGKSFGMWYIDAQGRMVNVPNVLSCTSDMAGGISLQAAIFTAEAKSLSSQLKEILWGR